MLPSWVTKLKDVKGSSRHRRNLSSSSSSFSSSFSSSVSSDSRGNARGKDPSLLAKAFGLQRANSRAKLSRSEAETAPSLDRSKSAPDSEKVFSSQVRDLDISKLLKDRPQDDADVWDREFSSMSSYGSEQDALLGKAGTILSSGSAFTSKHDVISDIETEVCSVTAELDSFGETSSTDSVSIRQHDREEAGEESQWPRSDILSTSVEPTGSLRIRLNGSNGSFLHRTSASLECTAERGPDDRSKRSPVSEAASFNAHSELLQMRRRQRSISISAVLPPDLQGVVGDSIALVKMSQSPYEDFRESMYQMIMEKDLEESLDMEELLYCYLSLNSPEHHKLIEEVFSDVWSSILMTLR